ncbi:Fis family transcriptional regulator [Selenomonas sp.]|nr:Fis family transcriptional regulator [Selenomonas sp.]
MNGSQSVIVQNKRIRYDFAIHRNITIICGDSATGKTTLVEMIQEYYDNGESSGIMLDCPKTCVTLSGRKWQAELALYHDSLVFIDEGNAFVTSEAFAKAIQGTDNYYIIVNRENLENLPYSVKEIYGIRTSGKYGDSEQTCNELYPIFSKTLSNVFQD